MGVGGTPSGADAASRFRDDLALVLLDIGSKDMTRGFGNNIGAMSIESVRYTFVSHDVVGDIVVGRVSVAVNMYETVPRSNCNVA